MFCQSGVDCLGTRSVQVVGNLKLLQFAAFHGVLKRMIIDGRECLLVGSSFRIHSAFLLPPRLGGLIGGDGLRRKPGLNGGFLRRLFSHSVHFLPCLCNEDA